MTEWENPIPDLTLLTEEAARSAVYLAVTEQSPPGSFAHTIATALIDLEWPPALEIVARLRPD